MIFRKAKSVAFDITELDQFMLVTPDPYYPVNNLTLFSPDDQVHEALQFLLNAATVSIDLAMYAFTDPTLCQVLTARAKAGIRVRMTLDSSQFKDDNEAAKLKALLASAGIDVSIGTSEKGAIMHLKSGIIDSLVTFTGSTNWSDSGEELQDNSLTVVVDSYVAAQYSARFTAIHTYQLSKDQSNG